MEADRVASIWPWSQPLGRPPGVRRTPLFPAEATKDALIWGRLQVTRGFRDAQGPGAGDSSLLDGFMELGDLCPRFPAHLKERH